MSDKMRQRLRTLISLLQQHPEGLTSPEIAADLGVSRKTAWEYIKRLEDDGFPIWDDQKRYFLDPDYQSNIILSIPQAWFMYLPLRRIVRANLHRFSLVKSLLYHIASLLHPEIADQLIPQDKASPDDEQNQIFVDLVRGWQRQQHVEIVYQRPNVDRPSTLVTAPWWFEPAVWSDAFYLIGGYERSAGSIEPITLKIDRILSVKLLPTQFERPSGYAITAQLEKTWGIWVGEGVIVKLRFHNRQLARLRETHWHPTQKLTIAEDGALLWEAFISEPQEMLPWLRGWGADMEVLEPLNIREQIASEAEATARLYGRSTEQPRRFFSGPLEQTEMDETPFAFQQQVQDFALEGKDLIIQAPTGAGKTRAALMPGLIGLHSKSTGENPPRIIYSVPMRVLASSFVKEHRKTAQTMYWDAPYHPTIQTGESPEDPLFEGRVIFATVDQVLASFLNIPYGLPDRLANINAGAMIGSYLIFDEFHLYPRGEMMLTVLAMLKMLKGISRFTLMSATFSPAFLREIASVLGAEVVANDQKPDLFDDVPSVATQERTFHAEQGVLTGGRILDLMGASNQCITICNTVDRAQALYRELKDQTNIECRLLHSRFYRKDRAEHEAFVRDRFENLDPTHKTILIATQVIEVGLNITSDVLISECAPAASLIQRAGRCARRKGEQGRVHIFQPHDEMGEVNYAPYIEDGQRDICEKTWDALSSERFNGQLMHYADEQHLIEIAHGEDDARFVDGLKTRIDARILHITDCMANHDDGYAPQLIRNTRQTIPLYVYNNPNNDDILTEKPWQREGINLSKGQLARFFEQTDAGDADFVLQVGIKERVEDAETPWAKTVYRWAKVQTSGEVYSYKNWLFAAHPQAVSYSKEIGLELRPGTEAAECSRKLTEPHWDRPRYEAERYHEHITGLWWAYRRETSQEDRHLLGLRSEVLYPLRRLCERLKVPDQVERAERLLRLTMALHDVGKLNRPWQTWARKWQQVRHEAGYPESVVSLTDLAPLAHTDYDSKDEQQRALQKGIGKRGNHAVEGAQASLEVLREACGDDPLWLAVTLSAIMRHHTPNADDCGAFALCEGSRDAIALALTVCDFEAEAHDWSQRVTDGFRCADGELSDAVYTTTPNLSRFDPALMYFLFVRVLRLADQRSGYYWRNSRAERLKSYE